MHKDAAGLNDKQASRGAVVQAQIFVGIGKAPRQSK
jgi:hypothetical protein